MNTVHLTPTMLQRMGAFQMRGLRYILKIEHAYYSGVSNREVYDKIKRVLTETSRGNHLSQQTISTTLKNEKAKRIHHGTAQQNLSTCK